MNNFNPSKLPVHPSVYGKINHLGKLPAHAPEQENKTPQKAFKPVIDFATTMANYRRYVAQDTKRANEYNKAIRAHNKTVKAHMASEQDPAKIAYHFQFESLNAGLSYLEFNEAAFKACELYGPIVKMQYEPTIKYAQEQTFGTLLHLYCKQVESNNALRELYPTRVLDQLPPLDLNSLLVTKIKREEGVYSLNVCKETVRAQRRRFEEKGVLVEYVYRGSYRGVHVRINPQILAFFEAREQKKSLIENQSLTSKSAKQFTDDLVITRTLKRVEKTNRQESDSVDKVSAEPTAQSQEPYRPAAKAGEEMNDEVGKINGITPLCKVEKTGSDSPGGGENYVKISDSEALLLEVVEPYEFAANLTRGDYDNYRPIDYGVLLREVNHGSLTRDEFFALWLQEMFKIMAMLLYKGRRDIYAGNWYNAYNHWAVNKFNLPKGGKQSKNNMLAWREEYIWRIVWAANWFDKQRRISKNPNLGPQYPTIYLNTHRTLKECVGFEYTAEKWKVKVNKILSKTDPEVILKNKAEREAQKLLARRSHLTKFETIIDEHFKGRKTQDQMFNYIADNLPPEYLDKATATIIERAKRVGLTFYA